MLRPLLLASFAVLPGLAHAQEIVVDTLDAPRAFAPGISIADPLSSEAWRGTPGPRAVRLLQNVPAETDNPIVRAMLRRVVLSGAAKPVDAGEDWEEARIAAARQLATPEEYTRFAERNLAARGPLLRAQAFIAAGDLASACPISDAVQQNRSDSVWIRIRAACHELRGETAAADLARGILRDRGEDPDLVVPEPTEGFWEDVLSLDADTLATRMTELAGEPDFIPLPEPENLDPATGPAETLGGQADALEGTQSVPFIFETDPVAPPQPTYNLDAAKADRTDMGTARLFLLARDGSADAVAVFARRAEATGLDPVRVMERIPAELDPTEMAETDLALFARYAVVTRDLPILQALFVATEDEATKTRLALASDALGGGYEGRPLGDGLSAAVEDGGNSAIRHTLIALGLGAVLSDPVEAALAQADLGSGGGAAWLGLDHAVERGAVAETLLRIARKLEDETGADAFELYNAIKALRDIGETELAGQLAAYEYLRGL